MATKYFVVSDTHGFYTLLRQALASQGFEENNPSHHLIVCGDAFDRGKEAKQMQDFLVSMQEQNRLIYICGNHEDLLIEMVCDLPQICDHIEWTHHASNGTLSTLCQLTGMTVSQIKRDPWRAQKYFSNTPFYKILLPEIVDYAEIGDHIFVHGWIPAFAHLDDFRNANEKEWREARWWNGMEMWRNKACRIPGKTIVCGHWHCSWGHAQDNPALYNEWGCHANFEPYDREGILAIDGCVAYSEIMNCVVLEI
jgi:serine/threonine protein phosphatase 1